MIWVLWDILIPLMASFALGTLLGWLIWSWRRRNRRMEETSAMEEAATTGESSGEMQSSMALASDDESTEQLHTDSAIAGSIDAHEQTSVSLRELEKANIVLISERDEANQAFENMQSEAEELRERVAELESNAQESANLSSHETDVETSASAVPSVSPAGIDNDVLSTPISALYSDSQDKQELEALRTDLQQLRDTLERERKARRATELELLNIKNRHDKLSGEIESSVSADNYRKEISDRDDEIESLKEQLTDLVQELDQRENTVIEAATISTEAEAEAVLKPAEVEPDSETSVSVASVAGIDTLETDIALSTNSQANSSQHQNNKPLKNGHTPKGWMVPDKKPTKKERDKLTAIRGVGPVLEKILHDCGIYYYEQVANLDQSGMEELQMQIPQFPGRIQRDKWVEQARELHEKKVSETT